MKRVVGANVAIAATRGGDGAVAGVEGLRVLRRTVQACKAHFGCVYGGEGGAVINRS